MMVCSKSQPFLFYILIIISTANYMVTSDEGCYQYRRKGNVTIDTDRCLWQNYTEPKPKRLCLDICFENDTVSIQQLYRPRASYESSGADFIMYWECIRSRTRTAPYPLNLLPFHTFPGGSPVWTDPSEEYRERMDEE